ncbi:MAG: HAMP domain-containing protein [Bacteroidales bacterium]|nr:HAMP domain-containing protein [Bacteroidales bacterium]
MRNFSFRFKIVGTIILLVSLLSLISFTAFNFFLRNKLLTNTEETYNQINLLRDQYYFTISQHNGSIIKLMLRNIEKDTNVLRTFLVDSKLKVTYPDNYSALTRDTAGFRKLFAEEKNITIKPYNKEPVPFYRVFIKMQNTSACYSCHDPAQKNLGLIVMDMSSHETQGIVSFTKRFSIFYTVFILLAIFALVAYLHYKYIRKSIKQFRSTITLINKGKLDSRLDIPEVRELGSLGKNFNEMLETFERTQKELQLYHQRELQNTQKLATIGEMSARIAHEIRNPITGISRAMEVIISEMKDSDNKPILEEIQRQANRVNQAISNLLRFSRSKDLSLQRGNVNEIIKSQVFFLKSQAHEKPINFDVVLNDDVPDISFDHELIENVLLNLSFNAMQSISGNGTIRYTAVYNKATSHVIISVSDDGAGIPSEIGSEIYKPFYTTRTKGTGLGLAISKDIVEKHKGELWYENNPGAGCTFFISLPA